MPQYEIYALKYAGPFTRTGAHLMWYRDWDKIEQINYYIWCIKGAGETVVVDAGVTPQMAAARGLDGYVNPAEVLARINVKAAEVRHVVITHMHFDHAGGVGLFPRATFYIQEDEYRFWREDPIAGRPPFKQVSDADSSGYLASLEGTDRLALLKGDQPILAGIECLLSPGHTVALQTVAVNTARGTAIIGSDCAHVFRNYQEDWPSALIVDLVGWMKTYDKIRQRVSSPDLLFPGHDRLMAENYPAVAADITRLVQEYNLLQLKFSEHQPGSWLEINKNPPNIADKIIVIGTPMGLGRTVSDGIISAIREIPDRPELKIEN